MASCSWPDPYLVSRNAQTFFACALAAAIPLNPSAGLGCKCLNKSSSRLEFGHVRKAERLLAIPTIFSSPCRLARVYLLGPLSEVRVVGNGKSLAARTVAARIPSWASW